jgi:hypothetical protein
MALCYFAAKIHKIIGFERFRCKATPNNENNYRRGLIFSKIETYKLHISKFSSIFAPIKIERL